MPQVDQTFKKILKRVNNRILFSKVCIVSFFVYLILKIIMNALLQKFPTYQLQFIITWRIMWLIFNLVQMPLWVYFWRMNNRFMAWLSLDESYVCIKTVVISIFFSLQLLYNITGGILDQYIIINASIENGCKYLGNIIQKSNFYLLSLNIFLSALVILFIVDHVSKMSLESS